MQRIVVLGGGFAGLWAAAGAARVLDRQGVGPDRVAVTLVNRDGWHAIRVRNYEADLSDVRVALHDVLDPIGVALQEAAVTGIDARDRTVATTAGPLPYDRLVFALGSRMPPPAIPGGERAFDVDTYDGAARLASHLRTLDGAADVLVVGAGLTGIEVAAEMTERLPGARVALFDRGAIGSNMGPHAMPVIETALQAMGVAMRPGVTVTAIDADGATLSTGERVADATVIWCAGMRAHPLTAALPVECDPAGRLPVDATLRIAGLEHAFAAGDAARLMVTPGHASVMSCQHSRPMGRFAGHNAACDLLGLPLLPLAIPSYVTCLDLGPWGAVYTQGWDRQVVSQGAAAKQTKQVINRQRIYPPRTDPASGGRAAILDAAAPVVQAAPPTRS